MVMINELTNTTKRVGKSDSMWQVKNIKIQAAFMKFSYYYILFYFWLWLLKIIELLLNCKVVISYILVQSEED